MSEHESKVPCKECGTPTAMTSTKLCDSCWEQDRHGVFELREQLAKVRKDRDAIIEDVTNDRDEWLQSSRDWRIRAEKAEERERALRAVRDELQAQVDRLNHKRTLTLEQNGKLLAERDRLRKAGNTLADAAKKRLSEWTRETYMAVQESETAWREAVGGGEVSDAG